MNHNCLAQFKVYKKDLKTFVETGSCIGGSILAALECGFEKIYSVEYFEQYYKECQNKFTNNEKVKLFIGHSADLLPEMMRDINEKSFIWLDAHAHGSQLGLPETDNRWKFCPLLYELDAIKQHPIKNHTILIDDINHLGTEVMDNITLEEIKNKILEINPEYKFDIVQNNGILAAYI